MPHRAPGQAPDTQAAWLSRDPKALACRPPSAPAPAPAPASIADLLLRHVSPVLGSAPPNSLPFDRLVSSLPRRARLTPAALASLLFGVASSLMLAGSVIFMVGAMVMPFVACFGTIACLGSVLSIFPLPWLWRGRGWW